MSHSSFEAVFKCGYYLAILPCSSGRKANKRPLVVGIFLSALFIYVARFYYIYETTFDFSVEDIIDIIADFMCLMCSVVILALFQGYTNNFFDSFFHIVNNFQKPQRYFTGIFAKYLLAEFFVTLAVIPPFIQGTYLWEDWDWLTSLCEAIIRWYACSTILVYIFLVKLIKSTNCILNSATRTLSTKPIYMYSNNITKFLEVYEDFLTFHTDFNKLFGWSAFCFIVNNVLVVISFLYYYFDDEVPTLLDWVLTLPELLCFMALVMMMALVCEDVSKESSKTVSLLSRAVTSVDDDELRYIFLIFIRRTYVQKPKFSAEGFFNINLAMLFMFINMITLYVVVIIQYNK